MFIENVGDLVSAYDLGEHLRVVLLSVTEAEDSRSSIRRFSIPRIAVMTKRDLAGAVRFDRRALLQNIQTVRPGLEVLEVSAATGDGLASWIARLEAPRR